MHLRYCLKELRHAVNLGKPVIPVIKAEDKPFIATLLERAPADVKGLLQQTDFVHIDRTDQEYLDVGILKVVKRLNLLPSPLTATGASITAFKSGASSMASIDNWWLTQAADGCFHINYHSHVGNIELDATMTVGNTSAVAAAKGRMITTVSGSSYRLLNLNPSVLRALEEGGARVVWDPDHPLDAHPPAGSFNHEQALMLNRAQQIAKSGDPTYA